MCSHVVILKKGVKLAEGEVSRLIRGKEVVVLAAEATEKLSSALEDSALVESVGKPDQDFEVTLKDGVRPADLSRELMEAGIVLTRLEVRKNTLEDQFLELVKQDNPLEP